MPTKTPLTNKKNYLHIEMQGGLLKQYCIKKLLLKIPINKYFPSTYTYIIDSARGADP